MKKNKDCRIIRLGDRILRILDAEGEKALVIDCVKMGMPKWISLSEIEDGVEIPGEEFMGEMERDIPEEKGGQRLKYDIDKVMLLTRAGMTEADICRRMCGMPLDTLRRYKAILRRKGKLC